MNAVPLVRRAKAAGSGRFTYFDRGQPWAEHVLPTALDVPEVTTDCVLRAKSCDEHREWADHSMIDVSRIKYYATVRLDSDVAAGMRDRLGPVEQLVSARPSPPALVVLPVRGDARHRGCNTRGRVARGGGGRVWTTAPTEGTCG